MTKDATEQPAEQDFYYDGPFVVFTAAFHLRRGVCCKSGCRHCPYGDVPGDKLPAPPAADTATCKPEVKT